MKLILFRGRPGSGKTTLSNLLSKEINIPILRKDDIYDLVSEYIQDHQIKNKISYGSLYAILGSNVQTSCTFIIDYPFHNDGDFLIIKEWCSKNNVRLQSILVTCSDEELWAQRFNTRAENPKPNQLLTNFEEMKNHYGSMQVEPQAGELVVDTANSQDTNLNQVKTFIGQ